MKNKIILSLCTLILLGTTSCKKENIAPNTTLISEDMRQTMLTNLVGTWQITETGTEVVMHEGHICTDPANMAADKLTYEVHWEKATTTNKRSFKSQGAYSLNAETTCSGNYTVSNHAVLEINGGCQTSFEKIVELNTVQLTLSVGTLYYKFTKLD